MGLCAFVQTHGIFERFIRTEQRRAHELLKITKQISKRMVDDTEEELINIAKNSFVF